MADLQHDIEKYLRGELTASEMHALERKALNDPFLADALEGAQHVGPDFLQADMLALQQRLNERTAVKRKVIPLWGWPMRIAAGLLLVAVSGYVVYTLVKVPSNNNLALRRENSPLQKDIARDTILAEEMVKEEPASTAQPEEQRSYSRVEKPVPPPQLSQPEEIQPSAEIAQAPVTADESPVIMDSKQEELAVETEAEKKQDDQVLSKQLEGRASGVQVQESIVDNKSRAKKSVPAAAPAKSNGIVIRGRVTSSEDDAGLPGVNVTISGTNVGTITDVEGNYQLTVEEMNQSIAFTYIGYESQELEMSSSADLNVEMAPDMSQLSEVVVVGYGSDKVITEEDNTYEFAAPVGGRAAYKQYLEKNLRYPEQALANDIEGKVTIQFTVESTGRISDFKVIKGLGYGCEEEVIRLVKKGPKWTPTKRNEEVTKDRVKVRMRFRLPKKK